MPRQIEHDGPRRIEHDGMSYEQRVEILAGIGRRIEAELKSIGQQLKQLDGRVKKLETLWHDMEVPNRKHTIYLTSCMLALAFVIAYAFAWRTY